MKTASDYIVEQTNMSLGRILDLLDKMKEEFLKVDIGTISEKYPDMLPAFHESFGKTEKALGQLSLVSIIANVASLKENADDPQL